MNQKKSLLVVGVAVVVLAAMVIFKSCSKPSNPPVVSSAVETVAPPAALITEPVVTAPVPEPVKPVVAPKRMAKKEIVSPTPVSSQAEMAPPPVVLHKELIPQNIEIVRVYYNQIITAPNTSIPFDINGSGFTKEFEKMIKVVSGQSEVEVRDLALVTPNQIHGTLVVSANSKTQVAFPQVLIQDKVVFQAKDPYAVIRPNEVLNLMFTEMGENGRTGRFRVFTNLTAESFQKFSVLVSTPAIQITDLTADLPFVVDGTINIGPALGGNYDLVVSLDKKAIWMREGIIRVVRPNVGQSGLIQRVQAMDGFHRPGDKVRFMIIGSGFQPDDAKSLSATVEGLVIAKSTFVYVAPGHLELEIELPWTAPVRGYGLKISNGSEVLQDMAEAFQIVPRNWVRFVKLEPALKPGGNSTFSLVGRDIDAKFMASIKVAVDEPGLKLGAFQHVSVQEISAPISADAAVAPGDYLVHMTSDGKAVQPQFGNIIRVSRP